MNGVMVQGSIIIAPTSCVIGSLRECLAFQPQILAAFPRQAPSEAWASAHPALRQKELDASQGLRHGTFLCNGWTTKDFVYVPNRYNPTDGSMAAAPGFSFVSIRKSSSPASAMWRLRPSSSNVRASTSFAPCRRSCD